LNEPISRNGSPREYFAQEDAAKGLGEKPVSRLSDVTQKHIVNNDPTFSQMGAEDNRSRNATPMEYVRQALPSQGEVSNNY
jgi:hypothetical protein